MKEGGGGGEGRKRLQTNPSILKTCVRQRTQRLIGSVSRTMLTCVDQRFVSYWEDGMVRDSGCCLFWSARFAFLLHPHSAFLLVPFFARSLTLVPRSLLLNRTETLATQATTTYTQRLWWEPPGAVCSWKFVVFHVYCSTFSGTCLQTTLGIFLRICLLL